MNIIKTLVASAFAATTFATLAFANEYKIGDLVITNPVARSTPTNAPVSAGYMTITNTGAAADRLTGGTVPFADKVELHEMIMDKDVMKMRPVEAGIEIPAGQSVTLMPGGLHMMFMGMQQQLADGEAHEATLTFEKAGDVTVTFNVEPLQKIREGMKAMGGHGTMKMAN